MGEIEWDARTEWATLEELERFNCHAGERDQGAIAPVLDLAQGFGRVSLPVVWAWATHFAFRRKILRVSRGYFQQERRVQFERMCGGAAPDHHGDSPWVKVEFFALAHCVAGRSE